MTTTLWGWGRNGFWELGVGDDSPRTRPTEVPAPELAAVYADDQRTFGIATDGALWAWGDEVGGRLGLSETDGYASTPFESLRLSGELAVDVASGRNYSYVRLANGGESQWSWWGKGRNEFHASFGDETGDSLTQITPFPYADVVEIKAFWEESIAITREGKVFTLRPNDGAASVMQVRGFLSPVVQVDTHGGDAAALDDQGRVYFWKLEQRWEEARRPWSDNLNPIFASLPSYQNLSPEPRQVFAGVQGRFQSVTLTSGGLLLALHSSGEAWATGSNRPWAVAGAPEAAWVEDIRLKGLPILTQLAGCSSHGFALDQAGRVWHWGTNQLVGSLPGSSVPAIVPEMEHVVHISAHSGNFLALTAN